MLIPLLKILNMKYLTTILFYSCFFLSCDGEKPPEPNRSKIDLETCKADDNRIQTTDPDIDSISHQKNVVEFDKALIHGWWKPGPHNGFPVYKGYYFGEDGSYIQDQTNHNLGIGTAKWEWSDETKVVISKPYGFSDDGSLKIRELTQHVLITHVLTLIRMPEEEISPVFN